jgi:hypothetical protein
MMAVAFKNPGLFWVDIARPHCIERDRIARDEAKRTADKYISRDGLRMFHPGRSPVRNIEAKRLADEYTPRPKPPQLYACRKSGYKNEVSKRCNPKCGCDLVDDIPF